MLSILIPTYNDNSLSLVRALCRQAEAVLGSDWEVIVGDDGSTDQAVVADLRTAGSLPRCRYLRPEHNVGRAAIRNRLAREARGEWLLLIDGDGKVICDDYLGCLVRAMPVADVCYGGYLMMPGPAGNLRWLYERHAAPRHTVEQRRRQPYACFCVSNLLIRRSLMLRYSLDERIRRYGYEDVMLGRKLREAGITVHHVEAPIGFSDYESNASFVAKTEEGLRTLYAFRADLRGYSRLLDMVEGWSRRRRQLVHRLYKLLGSRLRAHLVGRHPRMVLFQLYKAGYLTDLICLGQAQPEASDSPCPPAV